MFRDIQSQESGTPNDFQANCAIIRDPHGSVFTYKTSTEHELHKEVPCHDLCSQVSDIAQ
jgi:hypothetical protein